MLGQLRLDYSSYSGIARPRKGASPLIGQVHFNFGEQAARLVFLAPESALSSSALVALLDHLSWESSNRGAFRLLAEIDEDHPTFESFRHAGFSVYTRQHIWKLSLPETSAANGNGHWRPLHSIDQHSLQTLYHAVVPPLVQSAEAIDKRPLHGYAYISEGELLAFVEAINGPLGIFLQPVVHPNLRSPEEFLTSLLRQLPVVMGRPVYLAVRDYQSWFNGTANAMNGQSSTRRVLFVKHLARQQRVAVTSTLRKVLEQHSTEPTAPLARSQNGEKKEK
jgi:hypothetical protein